MLHRLMQTGKKKTKIRPKKTQMSMYVSVLQSGVRAEKLVMHVRSV